MSSAPNPSPGAEQEAQFKFYRPPQSSSTQQPHELPDSYFTPTAADLRAAQASLSARTQALVNAPLRTQTMRDADLKAKHARWPTTTIRVKFADRSQLEKTFSSSDKIRVVYAFVRGSLREDVRPIKFVLYQTPPKREFKVSDPAVRDKSLVELQLAPSSVLLLRFEDDSLNHHDVPAPLNSDILSRAEDLPLPPDFDSDAAPTPVSSSSAPSPAASSTVTPAPPGEKKIPKWLKLGPKK